MKLPESLPLRCAVLFSTELVAFFVIACNFRALAQGLYVWTALSDCWLVAQNMVITKLMFDDEKTRDWWSIASFSLGGACGSLCSIWVTKHLFGA